MCNYTQVRLLDIWEGGLAWLVREEGSAKHTDFGFLFLEGVPMQSRSLDRVSMVPGLHPHTTPLSAMRDTFRVQVQTHSFFFLPAFPLQIMPACFPPPPFTSFYFRLFGGQQN